MTRVTIGVDVGGTFTKAVGYDVDTGSVIARQVVPTSHEHDDGAAAGVVEAVRLLVDRLAVQGIPSERVALVTHSTTQAVNALLEADVDTVGLVGLGRAPDVRAARKRTMGHSVELAPGRPLPVQREFLDVTAGLSSEQAAAVVDRLHRAGATTFAVAEAFAPDDEGNERVVAQAAAEAGFPVTTSSDLTGLYGLELRTVTATLNASILPIAVRTAAVVEAGVAAVGLTCPVLVMRGDGGATDLAGFRAGPARTLYSGPAASVCGVLRTGSVTDAVVLEVGGTSTNVAAVRRGRPALSYVRVASHSTALRALDVRVLGVAGGSMLRARRGRVYGVGPRSAHIAGLPYSCFLPVADLDGAVPELVAPRPGDPPDHVVLRLQDGRTAAITLTCAANALGIAQAGDYAYADPAAARAAFAALARAWRTDPDRPAQHMIAAATQTIGDLVTAVAREHRLDAPDLVVVGGGAGAVGRAVATSMRLPLTIPADAEIISAVGDALSLIRAERERTMADPTAAQLDELLAEVEGEAIAAGAGAASLESRLEHVPDRGTVRAVVTGAVSLAAGALPGRDRAGSDRIREQVTDLGLDLVDPVGAFWVARTQAGGGTGRVVVLDLYADLALDVRGQVFLDAVGVPGRGGPLPERLASALDRHGRRVGPVDVGAEAWVVTGSRVIQVPDPRPETILATVDRLSRGGSAAVIIGRE